MYKRKDRNVDHFCHMVSGYLLLDAEVPGDEDDDDDLEEEEEDIQFLSYSEMNGVGQGKQLYEGKKMKCSKGVLKDLVRPNKSESVAAPFHFTDPWWNICMLRTRVVDRRRVPKDGTSLTYKIRQDEKVVRDKLVNMFLTKCLRPRDPDMTSEHRNENLMHLDKFLHFVEQKGLSKNLKFEYLEELMNDFMNSLPEENKITAEIVMKSLDTHEWACISKALKFPKLVSFLSQLLPMQFRSIMEDPENEGLVTDLSRALDTTPWVFGFKKLLYKDYNLTACEAPLMSLQRAEIFDQLDQVKKDALVIYDFLKTDSRMNGHTQISLPRLKDKHKNDCPEFDDALKFLKRHKIIKEIIINEDTKICLQQLYNYERKISEGIRDLYKQQLEDPWELDVDLESEEFSRIRGDREQLMAARKLLKHPVVVISGKGGCGKTTVVTKVLSYKSEKDKNRVEKCVDKDECEDEMSQVEDWNWDEYKFSQKYRDNLDDPDFPNSEMFPSSCNGNQSDPKENENLSSEKDELAHPTIIYTAPTGKAANLLGRRAKTTGYTLHQIIWSYRFFVTRTKKQEPNAEWKFQCVKTLVVDECSMVAVSTFSTILTTLMENSKLRRIVLLGDVRQLPSIEPGNFLADVYRAMYPIKSSIELMTNHRAESKLIIENATRISLQTYPLFSAEHNFSLHEVPQSEDKKSDMHDIVVKRILETEKSLEDDKRSQFVTFTNKYCEWINEHACKLYNKHATRNHKNKHDFRINDKICLKKNGMVIVFEQDDRGQINVKYLEGDLQPEEAADAMEITLLSQTLNGNTTQTADQLNMTTTQTVGGSSGEKKKKTPATIRLCNGEIYFIKDEVSTINNRGKETRYLKFSDEDPDGAREFWVNYREVMKKCKMRHSWARTIHTFQGSECENVVYVVGFCPVQNWQHVYTAVTRGKKAVHIVGTKQHLRKSIQKEADKRNTTLHHQLKEILPVEQILDELVNEDESVNNTPAKNQERFTKLKDKVSMDTELGLSLLNGETSTSTPLCQRNGLSNVSRKSQLGRVIDDQVPSPFSDSQWSDYGDETYIEATQTEQVNQINENSFDLMDSLEMTENSEVLGDLTAACDLLEASLAQNNKTEIKSGEPCNGNREVRHSFLNYHSAEKQKKGGDSSADSIHIDEFDSFSSPDSAVKRNATAKSYTTPKKQKLSKPDVNVSPTRHMFTQLTFK